MEATARSFTFMGNEGIVRIPFFQRGYVWRKDNWEELLSDLSNNSRSHFLGSLILKQQPARSGEPKEVLVIDGQQRLTTLSILIKALYDSFSQDVRENCKESIRQYLFYKKNKTDKHHLIKIQHSHTDSPYFTEVIRFGIDSEAPLSNSENRIFECYKYFKQEFTSLDSDTKEALFNSLLDQEKKILVVIDLHQEDEEQAIFDTINSAGVRLSTSDIIKNALFQKVIKLEGESAAVELYHDTWKEIFLTNKDTLRFWEKQRLTGRLLRDNLEILLHSIAVIKGFYDPEKHSLSDLSRLYKDQINGINSEVALREFIQEIKSYGQIYKDKMLVFDKSSLFAYNDSEQRLFHILNTLEISTFHPFLLYLYKTFSDDTAGLLNQFSLIERFVLRRIVGKLETKSFNKLSKDLIQNPSELENKLAEISDAQFMNGVKSVSNKVAALILFWIELKRRSVDSKYGIKDLKYDYTLEHIMPQKWTEYWKDIPQKYNSDGSSMTPELAKLDRTSKVYWIGNMTLLTSSLNTSLRNYEYKRKMEGENRKKGIRVYSDLSITKLDLVDPYDNGDKVWDESKIESRTAKLSREILQLW